MGEPLGSDNGNPRPMRAMNLANFLIAAGHQVVIFSSDFYHQKKKHRFGFYKEIKISDSCEIRLIPSPGYKKNIGFGRLWDHFVLSKNLKKILSEVQDCPDVAFVGYPPIEAASVMVTWLKDRQIPIMLDVKDQWPIIFTDALPKFLKTFGFFLLYPYFYLGRKVMRDATALSSVAPTFLNWSLSFCGRSIGQFDRVAPLSSSPGSLDKSDLIEAATWWDSRGVFDDKRTRLIFVGSHTRAFDIDPIIEAAIKCKDCQFVICGSGEHHQEWQTRFQGLDNVVLPGWVDYAKTKVLASRSLAALAPYKSSEDFQMSIPNKVIDYLSLGLPILSPLLGEVGDLIKNQSVGFCYANMDGVRLEDCIFELRNDPVLADKLSKKAIKTYNAQFNYESVYRDLVKTLEAMSANAK